MKKYGKKLRFKEAKRCLRLPLRGRPRRGLEGDRE